MTTTKKVELVVSPGPTHFVGNGFKVHNFIPSRYKLDMQRMSPFIMLDYNSKFYFPPTNEPRGVDVHPHRGFETVTIAYKGSVAHHDSSGGGGIISEGDVQWMTAASGVLHKEYHEKEWSAKGGDFQMVQLWINLPAKDKMSAPKYQAIKNQEFTNVNLPNGNVIEVIAGSYNNQNGPASTFTPVNMFNARIKAGTTTNFNFPAHYNTALLVIEGDITVNGTENAPTDNFVLMENKGETFDVTANTDALVLVLSAEPINEPIAAHGPFVMNTHEELIQAFDDYNKGKFGFLED